MILLDTNVVSEPLRPVPSARVIESIDAQPLEAMFVSAITVAELRAGVALLPACERRPGSPLPRPMATSRRALARKLSCAAR